MEVHVPIASGGKAVLKRLFYSIIHGDMFIASKERIQLLHYWTVVKENGAAAKQT